MNVRRTGGRRQLVYFFECYDVAAGGLIVPPFKATAEAIARLFQGRVLPNSAEEVDSDELDSDGRWFRLATGWGLYQDEDGERW